MNQELSFPANTNHFRSWLGISMIAFTYSALYVVNLGLPLGRTNYTTRIWNWSQMALALAALVIVLLKGRSLKLGTILLGAALGLASAFSHSLHDPGVWGSLEEGLAVWVCFLGGVVLFQVLKTRAIPAFQVPLASIGRSLLFGIVVAIPLAAINNLYFYLNSGTAQFMNVFYSALEALSPAIHEEIIFRFFVLAMSLHLLGDSASSSFGRFTPIFLAVVPHSLNHLPELFLQNPVMGLFMLVATSLLFGLPMALLQIKRNLETAIAFHWLIDFLRFLFGF